MDIITYVLSRKYTDKTVKGLGALKGAPCKVESIVPIQGGQRITLSWETDDGIKETQSFDVMDGEDGADGIGISSVSINGSYHLIVTYSNGTSVDAGSVVPDYEQLQNLPEINGVQLTGDKSIEDLGLVNNDTTYMDNGGAVAISCITSEQIAALFEN